MAGADVLSFFARNRHPDAKNPADSPVFYEPINSLLYAQSRPYGPRCFFHRKMGGFSAAGVLAGATSSSRASAGRVVGLVASIADRRLKNCFDVGFSFSGLVSSGISLAELPAMQIMFDRGTLLFKDLDPAYNPLNLPGIKWDERVSAFRAPGMQYLSITKKLIEDRIPFIDSVYHTPSLNLGNWKPVGLRPYQEAAMAAWFASGQRGIIGLPTGGGKTRVALKAISQINAPTLCLVPTRVLLEQWYQQLKEFYEGGIGIYGDGSRAFGAITVATFESAYRNIDRLGNRFHLLVIDEAHHFGVGMRDEILELSTAPFRLGLTATLPTHSDQLERTSKLIGPPVYELAIDDLKGKFLSDFEIYTLHLSLTSSEQNQYEIEIGAFRRFHSQFRENCPEASWEDFVRNASRSRVGRNAILSLRQARKMLSLTSAKARVLDSLLTRHRDQRILIFTADTESAYAISRKHLVMPLTSEIGRKERESALARYKNGELKVIISCRVLNEGYDVPDAEIGIILGGAFGKREHIQRIGRLLRVREGKKATIYELVCRGTLEVRQSKKRNDSFDTHLSA